MASDVREFVMAHELVSNHDHHWSLEEFERNRANWDHRSLLGYADADLAAAAGAWPSGAAGDAWVAEHWPHVKTTGYGRAVTLGVRELFDLEYGPETFEPVTRALRASFEGRSGRDVFAHYLKDRANVSWVIQDGIMRPGAAFGDGLYPECYRFAWRFDALFSPAGLGPVETLERETGIEALTLDRFVAAMNASVDRAKATGRLAAIKIGMAYERDLSVADPTRHDAERAFNRIRNPGAFSDGLQQSAAAVDARASRDLGDWMFHRVMERAHDDRLPVQVHTGYLAGNWGSLGRTQALRLVPVFAKYRRVRFDVFHASWPWASELGAIAKNYPNVHPDLSWAWTMNPAASERALSEWLDCVPFNKIFGFGADTGAPWCDVGYAVQARRGIANVLEAKVTRGEFSASTARDVADAVMSGNARRFFGLD